MSNGYVYAMPFAIRCVHCGGVPMSTGIDPRIGRAEAKCVQAGCEMKDVPFHFQMPRIEVIYER